MKKQKFYVVWSGVTPGIYRTWTECQLQTKGYAGAKYKSFDTLQEAEEAFASSPAEYIRPAGTPQAPRQAAGPCLPPGLKGQALAVDAACSGNPGKMEYRGVHLPSFQQAFHFGPLYGNASSMHTFGGQVGRAVEDAREKMAALLGAQPEEILFTSCGSESDNTAIWSALQTQPEKRRIITTRVEHPAILNVCQYWERQGYHVTYLGVDGKGRLDLDEYAEALSEDTALVSVVSLPDLMQRARSFANNSYLYFETYTVIALIYLIITLLLSKVVSIMESRLNYYDGKR